LADQCLLWDQALRAGVVSYTFTESTAQSTGDIAHSRQKKTKAAKKLTALAFYIFLFNKEETND